MFPKAVWTVALVLLIAGCATGDRTGSRSAEGPNVVEVVARGLQFEAPDVIPSGWTTFRLKNESTMTHFGVLEKMPEGFGIREQQQQAAPVFQRGMDLLNAGQTDAAMAKFGELPEWFGKVVYMGGPGLTAPKRTSQTTVYLEPGTYVIECYVKTNGVFHSYNADPSSYGMVHQFIVTGEASGAPEPHGALDITISSARGIEVKGAPAAGEQTVTVHFEDQKLHENFAGHDVHLVRLTDGTDIEKLAAWMDWRLPHGLETPAPAEFLGGTEEMPAGKTAYFTIHLEPGRYAWISEVPDPQAKGMLKIFALP